MRKPHGPTPNPSPFEWRDRPAATDWRRDRPHAALRSARTVGERLLAPRWGGAYTRAVPSERAQAAGASE